MRRTRDNLSGCEDRLIGAIRGRFVALCDGGGAATLEKTVKIWYVSDALRTTRRISVLGRIVRTLMVRPDTKGLGLSG